MKNKTPAILSVVLSVFLLIVFAVLSILFEMLALNGASESQGMTAIGISILCQGVATILAGIFAWWLSNLLISKFNWNKILAVVITVLFITTIGAVISFLSIIVSIPIAGIR